jgi:hypothetical protein
MIHENPSSNLDFEAGWPCQRLRLGYGLVFFFAFEVTYGRQLPQVMPFLMLGLGLALLVSAFQSIRSWKLRTKIALIQEALERSSRAPGR